MLPNGVYKPGKWLRVDFFHPNTIDAHKPRLNLQQPLQRLLN